MAGLTNLDSAAAATSPAQLVTRCRYDGANVSGQVTSQTSNFPPLFQETIEAPSGRLPSLRDMPVGSNREGM